MTLRDNILNRLIDSNNVAISGEQLALSLNVTRSAVWKAIKDLKSQGYDIRATTNKGYIMYLDQDLLSKTAIEKNLNKLAHRLSIEVIDSLNSTNDYAKIIANNGAAEGSIIIANEQTRGRGRNGRIFYSPKNTGIYFSIILRPNLSSQESILITTAAATAVCLAIEKLTKLNTQIKWINDILIDNKKVGGILTEGAFSIENNKFDYIVLGIGLNLYFPQDGFPQDISKFATGLLKNEEVNLKNKIIAEILVNFFYYYDNLSKKLFFNDYKERMVALGHKIDVITYNESYKATLLDIDENFNLIVKTFTDNIKTLNSGEISIGL